MTNGDLAHATRNLIDRSTVPVHHGTHSRRGTVTATSPLTVELSTGITLPVGCLPRVNPIVGDIVKVEVDGASWTVVDKVSDGYIDWSATADLAFNGGGYVKGNATVDAHYKISDNECHYYGIYVRGSSTVWPNAAILISLLPVNIHISYLFAGQNWVEVGSADALNAGVTGYTGKMMANLVTQAFFSSNVATSPAFWSGTTLPFPWGTGDAIHWDMRYRIA